MCVVVGLLSVQFFLDRRERCPIFESCVLRNIIRVLNFFAGLNLYIQFWHCVLLPCYSLLFTKITTRVNSNAIRWLIDTMPPLLTGQVSGYTPIAENNPDDCVCRVKCVLVGDGAVGKTSLIIGYTTNAYPREYMPTAYDKYSVVVNINNQPVRLQICDTAGQDDFDALRPLCYPHTDVFLLCFSVVYPTSFYNIAEKWTYEIRHHCPKVPIILVGTQSDLRTDIGVLVDLANYREQPVSVQEAKALASKIGAVSYVECSAVTRRNLKEVFDTALLSALKVRRPELIYPGTHDDHQSKSGHKGSKYFDSEDIRKKRGWKKLWCFS